MTLAIIVGGGWAADLIDQVPVTASAYAQLRQLGQQRMLAEGWEAQLNRAPQHPLTRYDFAFLLIEPLERFCTLVQAQENAGLTPEQRRRNDLALETIRALTPAELDNLLVTTNKLLVSFSDAIDELSPALSTQATSALRKLGLPRFRPWFDSVMRITTLDPEVHIKVNNTAPDPIGNPLSLVPTHTASAPLGHALAFSADGGDHAAPTLRPANSLEAALDLALGPLRVYGAIGSLPGKDPVTMFKLDGNRTSMLGVSVDVLHLNSISINVIGEVHFVRTGDPGNTDLSAGAVGGIGVSW